MKYLYPTLLQSANNINSHSWFNIKYYQNKNYKKKKKKKKINYNYINTLKITLQLNDSQQNIINRWLRDCTVIYNLANYYIKISLTNENHKKLLNFISLRDTLNGMLKIMCERNKLNKHTADYVIKHLIEMYKSAYSNHKDINKFNIKDLELKRRRYNLVIEPLSVSKNENSIFIRQLGKIISSLPLSTITQNSILQYDSHRKTYVIITPKNVKASKEVNQYKKCGIDIGVRTFLTVYSKAESYEIGTKTNKIIDRYNERLDNIKSNFNENIINGKRYNQLWIKYSEKLKNKINDMHNKSANLLLTNFETIIIGKVSINKMISNIKGNLKSITKRRLIALSHYKFRMKLKQMAVKYGTKIIEVNEYLTSKNCHNCNKINDNLGANKVFDCPNCKTIMDRDINASINIYINRTLSRS
jgi:putative transposase